MRKFLWRGGTPGAREVSQALVGPRLLPGPGGDTLPALHLPETRLTACVPGRQGRT